MGRTGKKILFCKKFSFAPTSRHIPPHGGTIVAAPCLHSKDNPAPKRRGRDQLRQAAFSPKANTRVAKRLGFHEVKANLEGDSGPPRDGREPSWARPCEASGALFLSNEGVRGRPCSMHPLAAPGTLWVLSSDGKYLVRPQADETSHKEQISCARQGKGPILLFPYHKEFRLCGGDQRAFRSPFGNLRALCSKREFAAKKIL